MIVAAAVVAIAAAASFVVVLGGDDGGGETPGAGGAAKATGTATVARRTLAERVTVEGTIGYAGETTVPARLSGTVTELPAVGDVVRRGEELYGIDGEPVILMYGKVPAYRGLAEGVAEGADVLQLESNLADLGYYPGTVDEEFTSSTAEAIEAWQEDLGLEATGAVELGRVAFLPGPQRITQLEATLGEALGGGGGGGGSQLTAYEVPAVGEAAPPAAEEPEKEEPAEEPEEEPAEEEAEEKPAPKPKREKEPQKREPKSAAEPRQAEPEGEAKPEAKAEPEGEKEPEPEEEKEETEAPSTPILKAGSTRRIVSVALEADQQSVAKRGQKVEVVLPGGAEVPGRVRRLAAVEASGEGAPGEEPESGVEATISVTGKHRIPALDGASVSVLFTQQVRRHVLSVPLTALVAVGGGRFAVYVREGGVRRQLVVAPGLAADGYVEVEGEGLRAGMKVETGE
jgi:peptidoglycan hydrolase-like protein with peptidoglycan-binding domain